ncbi:NAD(P)/FAD-dependent oxidoreductase [Mesoaciditoga lauensis]|uniref:NAD(P)/FAD-dependent oxidoreductase n=1 Tax=Mesoaciditoga lauensis TaxID=1495039 RepID=UPI00316ACC67
MTGLKIAVVGFGAAAIGFVSELVGTSHEIHIFERSKDVYSASISGVRSDGKLFVSSNMGGDIEIPLPLQKEVVDYYTSKLESNERNNIKKGVSFSEESPFFDRFYSEGFEPVKSEFFHIGTDKLPIILKKIYDEFSAAPNIHFHFNARVDDVIAQDGKTKVRAGNFEDSFDMAVISVGRSGHLLVKKIIKRDPALVLSGNVVDVGVRYEVPNHVVKRLNEEMYEFKVRMRAKTGYMVRTFCNNPSGKVVLEEYDDFVTVNGHSTSVASSENTNFAILCSTSFTEPFNDPVGYGSYIAKLGNILAGGRKVLVQTYEDFVNCKRTKKLGRVKPTLSENSYVLGDVNLVLPRRIALSISEFIRKLGNVVEGLAYPDNLMYAVEVKFYSNKLDNEKYENLKFIGDCSGYTRSITYATAHGKMLARKIRGV